MKLSVAVAGKGGTGKTTFSALVIRALRERGQSPILAVDADPNSTLADALGVEVERSLADIREKGSSSEGSPASGVGRVRAVEDDVQRAIVEETGFDLIAMGHPEGPRCYCYVNSLLRKSLDELANSYSSLVLDNEAGMEHLSRRTTNDVNFLVAVMNPTMPSLRAVQRVIKLSQDLPINIAHRMVVVNRVGPDGVPQEIEEELSKLDAKRLDNVPQDDAVERAGAAGKDVFGLPEQTPALAAVRGIVETFGSLPSTNKST